MVILDEADAMTSEAQGALRRVIEKYTSSTRFCMICNYVNKIMPALQSRCTRFRFAPLHSDQIAGRLNDIIRAENVNVTESGKNALLQLAGGDFRRVLNLLQSADMAYDVVDEESVYLTAGAAVPAVIDKMFHSLMNDGFEDAYRSILESNKNFGYALSDIVTCISTIVASTELPDEALGYLLDKLSSIEYRLSHGTSDKIQLGALVSAFTVARSMMSK